MAEKRKWGTCECGTEMAPGSGCLFTHIHLEGSGELSAESCVPREPYDGSWNDGGPCPDCNAGVGKLHHDGCDVERCPRCGDQMLGCDCWDTYVTSG